MIRAASFGENGDKPLLLLGLSAENARRLVTRGEPIVLRADEVAELGLPAVGIIIAYGVTEDDLIAEMRKGGITFGTILDRRKQ